MNRIVALLFYLCDPARCKHKRAAKLLAKRRANQEMNTESILRSAQRLAEGEKQYQLEKGNYFWLIFLKRESTILLRRVIKFWLRLRLGRAK